MAILGISAFVPSITSSGIFSCRKVDSAANAQNPFVGAMNMDIAGGQVLNAAKGVSNIAKCSQNSLSSSIVSAEESIRNLAKTDKVAGGISKVLNITANNINPLICLTSGIKVATSDNKEDALIEEGCAIGTMFAAERAAKSLIGIPKTENYDPKTMVEKADGIYKILKDQEELIAKKGQYRLTKDQVIINREGLYKKLPFLEKQSEAIKDYCATKKVFNKSIKFLPGTIKGLGFVCASIGGYKLGQALSNEILGKQSA